MLYKHKSKILFILGIFLGMILLLMFPRSNKVSNFKILDLYTLDNIIYVKTIDATKTDTIVAIVDDVIVLESSIVSSDIYTTYAIYTAKIDASFSIGHANGKKQTIVDFKDGMTFTLNNQVFIFDELRQKFKLESLIEYNKIYELTALTSTYKVLVSDFYYKEKEAYFSIELEDIDILPFINIINEEGVRLNYRLTNVTSIDKKQKLTYKVSKVEDKPIQLLIKVGSSIEDIKEQAVSKVTLN